MEILKDKSYKTYLALSRYAPFPYYYNSEDDKFVYGLTKHVDENISYSLHTVEESDSLDSLALFYYGRPDYYWVIADFNRIRDPFIHLKDEFKEIKIPTLTNVAFEDGR